MYRLWSPFVFDGITLLVFLMSMSWTKIISSPSLCSMPYYHLQVSMAEMSIKIQVRFNQVCKKRIHVFWQVATCLVFVQKQYSPCTCVQLL